MTTADRARPPRHRRSALRAFFVALSTLLLVDQLALWTVLRDGYLGERRIAPFDPPLFNEANRRYYQRIQDHLDENDPPREALRFDPELGWGVPPARRLDDNRTWDASGCRSGPEPLSLERREGRRRLVSLGCSFTFGAEVADDETWPYQLDAALDEVEVGNLGLGGHGLDQTLLRWRRDGVRLRPDEVWLGWLPAAALRVVSCTRTTQNHQATTILPKPRFHLSEEGALLEEPSPAATLEELRNLYSRPGAFFEAFRDRDLWVARTPAAYAPTGSRAMHYTALGRMWLTSREYRDREVAPWLLAPDSEVYRLTRALILQMREEVEATGARFRFLVLPGKIDLRHEERTGARYWSALLDDLRSLGVALVDLTGTLQNAGGAGRAELWRPGGHWSPEANRIVARELSGTL